MQSSREASCNVSQRGIKHFSLIELLIVIAIIAILVGMLLPALNKARAKASQTSCISNMKQLFQAQSEYMDSYNDWLPKGGLPITASKIVDLILVCWKPLFICRAFG